MTQKNHSVFIVTTIQVPNMYIRSSYDGFFFFSSHDVLIPFIHRDQPLERVRTSV